MTVLVYFLIPICILLFRRLSIYKTYRFTVLLILVLLFGLRDLSVGTDTKAYYYIFQNLELYGKEPGYFLLMKIVSHLTDNYNVLLLAIGAIMYIFILKSINDYSEDFSLSVFCLIFLGFFPASMNGMRQYIAMAFCFFATRYIIRGQKFKFALFVLVAATFHFSAIVMLAYYPLVRLKRFPYLFLFLLLLMVFLLIGEYHLKLVKLLGYGHYIGSKYIIPFTIDKSLFGNIIMRVVPNLVLFFFLCINNQIFNKGSLYDKYLVNIMGVSLLASILSGYGLTFYRAFEFFWIHSIIAIPNSIAKIQSRQRPVIYVLLVALLLAYGSYIIFKWRLNEVVPYVLCF